MPNGSLKIFDSHARDSFGFPHPHGTCVLLEVSSINNLIYYFKIFYKVDILFELKGIKINVAQFTQIANLHTKHSHDTNTCPSIPNIKTFNDKFNSGQCCAMCYYCICFSTISACSYWNDHTLSAIVEYANLHYQEGIKNGNEFTCDYLPQIFNICGVDVEVVFNSRYQGTLSSVSSKDLIKRLILENTTDNTGCLLWLSNYYLACIFQHAKTTKQNTTKYFLVACDERQT